MLHKVYLVMVVGEGGQAFFGIFSSREVADEAIKEATAGKGGPDFRTYVIYSDLWGVEEAEEVRAPSPPRPRYVARSEGSERGKEGRERPPSHTWSPGEGRLAGRPQERWTPPGARGPTLLTVPQSKSEP
jgi:hypothetical protein